MFITKKEFHKRANRKAIYNNYIVTWNHFCDVCSAMLDFKRRAERIRLDVRDTTHLYNYIDRMISDAQDGPAITVAHKYEDGVEFTNIVASLNAWVDLHVMYSRIFCAKERYRAICEFYSYVCKHNLTLSQKPAGKELPNES